jgi:hypothetical protein
LSGQPLLGSFFCAERSQMNFVLTYSTFESLFGGNGKFLNDKPYVGLGLDWAKRYFDFFVLRYVTNGEINRKFDGHFPRGAAETWVKGKLLCNESVTDEESAWHHSG